MKPKNANRTPEVELKKKSKDILFCAFQLCSGHTYFTIVCYGPLKNMSSNDYFGEMDGEFESNAKISTRHMDDLCKFIGFFFCRIKIVLN